MVAEAMERIRAAETAARVKKEEARHQAKELLRRAEQEGEAHLTVRRSLLRRERREREEELRKKLARLEAAEHTETKKQCDALARRGAENMTGAVRRLAREVAGE